MYSRDPYFSISFFILQIYLFLLALVHIIFFLHGTYNIYIYICIAETTSVQSYLSCSGGQYSLYPGNIWRVVYWKSDCHMALSVCRGIGDNHYNDHADIISARPQIVQEKVTPQDRFLVIACDGLWDVLSNQEVCDYVLNGLNEGKSYEHIAGALAQHAIADKRSEDNVTVLVIGLNGSH